MRELDQTIGLIGFGSVGRATARRAQAFDMRILAVDAYPGPKPDYVESLEGLEGLPRLLAESDVVVVTVPYTKDTDHMIGAEQIAMMKKGAYLIAISRGKIVDEDALVAVLTEPKNAVVKQFARLFELDKVELIFTPEALRAAAREAMKLKTGARGLRTIIEGVLLDVMYEIPSHPEVEKCVVNAECITRAAPPLLLAADGQAVAWGDAFTKKSA